PAVPRWGGAVAGREDVHLDVVGRGGEVAGEAVPAGDLERDDADLPRVARRDEGLLDAPDLQHEHPPRAELDGPAERDAVHEASVQIVMVVDPDRGEQAGDRGGGQDGVDDWSAVEPVLG